MMQAARFECFLFDPFAFYENGFVPAEVDIGGCDIVQALVITLGEPLSNAPNVATVLFSLMLGSSLLGFLT